MNIVENRRYRTFVTLYQRVSWVFSHLIYRTIYAVEIRGDREMVRRIGRTGALFVANHESALFDHWRLSMTLDYKTWRALTPFVPLATLSWRTRWLRPLRALITTFVYFPNGVVTLVRREESNGMTMEEKLENFRRVLATGECGLMYPEGHSRRTDEPAIRGFRPGVTYLYFAVGMPIVPVITRLGKRHWFNAFRRELVISFGDAIRLPEEFSDDYEAGAEHIRKNVVKLYEEIE